MKNLSDSDLIGFDLQFGVPRAKKVAKPLPLSDWKPKWRSKTIKNDILKFFNGPTTLEVSSPEKEGAFLVSKLIKLPILFDDTELAHFFAYLQEHFAHLFLFSAGGILSKGKESILLSTFLEKYRIYVQCLKKGDMPPLDVFRSLFSSMLTINLDAVYRLPLKEERFLIKPRKPIVQIQPHHFFYSKEDSSIRSMVFSKESVTWGLLFSYPQIYQDPKTHEIYAATDQDKFPNTLLFKHIQKWVRAHTRATPFLIEGQKFNHPMRIGKECFSWIEKHPQLKQKGLQIIG